MGPDRENGSGPLDPGFDALRRDVEHVARYRAEMDRRLGVSGVDSIGAVIELYDRLRTALGALTADELAWTQERVTRIIEQLESHRSALAALRELKRRIDG